MQLTLLLESPARHKRPDVDGRVVAHFLGRPGPQHIVLEWPNWANAKVSGGAAALAAWNAFSEHPKAFLANPCDPEELTIWVIQPGFPKPGSPLWMESFGYYRAIARELTLVHQVVPVPGTRETQLLPRPLGLSEALSLWGPGFTLSHPEALEG